MPSARVPTRCRLALSAAGYATPLYGKWHLGSENGLLPNDQGFDDWFGIPHTTDEAILCRSGTAYYRAPPSMPTLRPGLAEFRVDPVAGLRAPASQRRGTGEILPEDRHQHARHPVATGADLHVGDELLRIRQRRRKYLWVRVGKFGDGLEHKLELA